MATGPRGSLNQQAHFNPATGIETSFGILVLTTDHGTLTLERIKIRKKQTPGGPLPLPNLNPNRNPLPRP
jgi:hypothetical protein